MTAPIEGEVSGAVVNVTRARSDTLEFEHVLDALDVDVAARVCVAEPRGKALGAFDSDVRRAQHRFTLGVEPSAAALVAERAGGAG